MTRYEIALKKSLAAFTNEEIHNGKICEVCKKHEFCDDILYGGCVWSRREPLDLERFEPIESLIKPYVSIPVIPRGIE